MVDGRSENDPVSYKAHRKIWRNIKLNFFFHQEAFKPNVWEKLILKTTEKHLVADTKK